MTVAIEITLIGMGLVFAAILLLWLLMALIVRFTAERTPAEQVESSDREQKIKAAAIAVSLALAEQGSNLPHEFPLPPTAIVSAWQVVMRSKIINKRIRTR
jgi:Na+-transporting methylmalonyl-CoA/oxaloacetate decarboxylase gamma subunit